MSGTTGVVTFDYATWLARYPELACVSQAAAAEYFIEAGFYLENTATSVVQDTGQRAVLLNMLVAHIAALSLRGSSQVGRISDAAEGSVHVAFESMPATGSSAWYQQTQYGASFWRATGPYRTMRYYAPYQPFAQPPVPLPPNSDGT